MSKDTRDRNNYFDKRSLETYFKEYSKRISEALETVSIGNMEAAHLQLLRGDSGRVFVGGNGGSAAISDHLTCDFTKGIKKDGKHSFNVISLCGSHALHTAIANDLGYEKTLSYQLELHSICRLDTVILISSSGNSPNIVSAAETAYAAGSCLISMTGFDGGKLNKVSDIQLHVNADNYGIVEDCHQILMHTLAQYIYLND